ncbi:MAG TPA: HAD family hydrolase [Pseudonocardiaceae bacterium]|jgi:HAD superfamily hydrolase (TIGR01509 family)|nr:HAD family hydrolase [Pseudonocardiaceae bacterium]
MEENVTAPAGVLWDMDGTLIDSEKLWDVSLRELVIHLGGGELRQRVREELVGSNMQRTCEVLLAEAGRPITQAAVREASRWLTDRTRELFATDLPWRPGAQEALKAIRASGVPTALVTSTERDLTEVALNTIGREYFDVTVCGDEVDGRNKPDPCPYLSAARLLGVEATRCVAIEDSATGVASAEAAGCAVLAVPCDAPVPPGPRRTLRDSLVGVDIDVLSDLLASRVG